MVQQLDTFSHHLFQIIVNSYLLLSSYSGMYRCHIQITCIELLSIFTYWHTICRKELDCLDVQAYGLVNGLVHDQLCYTCNTCMVILGVEIPVYYMCSRYMYDTHVLHM